MADTESLSNYTLSPPPADSEDAPTTLKLNMDGSHGCVGGKIMKTCTECTLGMNKKEETCKNCNGAMLLQADCEVCQSIKKHASNHSRSDSVFD